MSEMNMNPESLRDNFMERSRLAANRLSDLLASMPEESRGYSDVQADSNEHATDVPDNGIDPEN